MDWREFLSSFRSAGYVISTYGHAWHDNFWQESWVLLIMFDQKPEPIDVWCTRRHSHRVRYHTSSCAILAFQYPHYWLGDVLKQLTAMAR